MKKILITGASGFIGSFMIEAALSKGYEVWAGIRATSSRKYLQDSRIRFIDLPYNDEKKLNDLLTGFKEKEGKWDVIIHNAGVTQCVDFRDFEKINYTYTRHFADALVRQNMIPGVFIYMSSLSVYGPGDEVNMRPIMLSDIPQPNTEYGKSKLKAEQYLTSLPGFPLVIMRPTGVYGPRDKDYYILIKTVLSGLDVSAGFKPQKITFIYVKDLVKAVFLAIEKAKPGSAYFISDGKVYTSKDYTRYVKQKLELKRVISICVPLWAVRFISSSIGAIMQKMGRSFTLNKDKYKIMKQRNWCCETLPLEQELGFIPEYDLEMGVNESIEWYKANGWL